MINAKNNNKQQQEIILEDYCIMKILFKKILLYQIKIMNYQIITTENNKFKLEIGNSELILLKILIILKIF